MSPLMKDSWTYLGHVLAVFCVYLVNVNIVLVPVVLVLHESTLFERDVLRQPESAVIEDIFLAAPEHISGFFKKIPVYRHIG